MLLISRFRRLSSPIAVAALLSGCSVGPDFLHPVTPTPALWSEPDAPDRSPVSADWWKTFGQAELDALIERGQSGSFDLAIAVARVREADAQVRISSAPLLPAVIASSGAGRQGSQSLVSGQGSVYNNFSILLGASYELDFWGKNADARQAAEANRQASEFDRQTTRLTLNATIANTYFTLLSLSERIKVAERNLANSLTTLEAFQARAGVGMASGLDLAQQESVVAEQRAALPPLYQALRQNTYALSTLIGVLPEEVKAPQSRLNSVKLPSVTAGLPSTLLTRRPDVQFAEAQLVAANANIKQAIASIFPSVVLTAEGGAQSNALGTLLQSKGSLFSLGAGVTQPIFKGGALLGGIDLAEATYDELLTSYRKSVVSAFQDVESALVAVEMTAKQEVAQRVAEDTALKAYEITQEQMRSGTVDILTVLNVQRTLFQAQDLTLQVRLAHLSAIVSLYRALGGGWSVEGQQAG